MKVKQLLKHFWHGASAIELVEIIRDKKVLVTLNDDDLSEGYYGGFENDKVLVFMVADTTLQIVLDR